MGKLLTSQSARPIPTQEDFEAYRGAHTLKYGHPCPGIGSVLHAVARDSNCSRGQNLLPILRSVLSAIITGLLPSTSIMTTARRAGPTLRDSHVRISVATATPPMEQLRGASSCRRISPSVHRNSANLWSDILTAEWRLTLKPPRICMTWRVARPNPCSFLFPSTAGPSTPPLLRHPIPCGNGWLWSG